MQLYMVCEGSAYWDFQHNAWSFELGAHCLTPNYEWAERVAVRKEARLYLAIVWFELLEDHGLHS